MEHYDYFEDTDVDGDRMLIKQFGTQVMLTVESHDWLLNKAKVSKLIKVLETLHERL